MALWQRLAITVTTMLVTSFLAGLLWRSIFSAELPGYLSGVIGGLTALPVWELLKRTDNRRGPIPLSKEKTRADGPAIDRNDRAGEQ